MPPEKDSIVAIGSDNHYYLRGTRLPKFGALHMRRNRERLLRKIHWLKIIFCDQQKEKATHPKMHRLIYV
jgi:hypothetical protein